MISLMYHCVYTNTISESGFQNLSAMQYKIRADEFRRQVEAIDSYCKRNKVSLDSVEFSFDDGGVSFYDVIAPILEQFNFRGLFFISTKYIGTKGFLNEKQIQDLYYRGHTIASHSHSHPDNLAKLSNDEIFFEWQTSHKRLQQIIGSTNIMASIPNGVNSRKIYRLAYEAGYGKLYTSAPTTKIHYFKNMQIIGRFVVHNNTTTDDIISIISSSHTRKKIWFYWSILVFIKSILGHNYNTVKSFILKR